MKLTDLKPQFLKILDKNRAQHVDNIKDADGMRFLCPKCFAENGGPKGTHSITCWQLHVKPEEAHEGPGRWNFAGTGYDDITFVNGSSSIAINGGCFAHFFIEQGNVRNA
ncbi:MAG: hypothetical protein ACM34K_01300 [Bacillota bacterium]